MHNREESVTDRINTYRDHHYIPPNRERNLHDMIGVAQEAVDEPIKDIFITNVRNIQAHRGAKDLWLFSDYYAIYIQNFFAQAGFTILPLTKSIRELIIQPVDYVPFSASCFDTSILLVQFAVRGVFELKAFAENCPILSDVVRKRIIPNMRSDEYPLTMDIGPARIDERWRPTTTARRAL